MTTSDATAKDLLTHGLDAVGEALPSGHVVTVQVGEQGEQVVVTGPDGQVRVRIELSETPVVTLSAASLKLEALDTVAVSCRRFEVRATEEATIASRGTLDLESGEEMHLTADADLKAISPMIWLN
ncbi:MAG: hypothetical protein O2888_04640 [Chloroflexi bacterium]|nr:hypothetical protein [Chloroflexota bacterium]